ncbi:MAG: co-chaperone YbbN [Pseudomonadota bacterium]
MSNDDFIIGGDAQAPASQSVNVSFGGGGETSQVGGVKDISTQEFMKEVIETSSQIPVLVDFWAPWCEPCKQLAPALEAAVAATRGKVKLVKMDIDKHPEVAGQMGIQSIPAVVAFIDGRPADAFMGAKTEGEIREFIGKVAGPDSQDQQIDAMLEQAEQLMNEGAIGEAGNIYGHILSIEPKNLKAIAAVGQLYLKEDNIDGAKGVMLQLDDDALESVEITSLRSAIDLAEQASDLAGYSELLAEVDKNPKNYDKRLELALALNASGKREEAADNLLEIIKQQPGWNEDAAKTQLLQFFEAWGMTDEATVSARRRLSSLLFS